MASLLSGIELMKGMGFYSVLFPWLLVFSIIYGIFSKVKPFGDDKHINVVVSAIIAFIMISFTSTVTFINYIIPYFALFFVIILFVLMFFQFMGVKSDTFQEAFEHPAVFGTIILVILVGTFFFISESFPELSTTGDQYPTEGVGEDVPVSEGAVEIGEGESVSESGQTSVVSESESLQARQSTLRRTIFHPTMLGLLVMFAVFGAATYMIAVVKER